MDEYRAMLSGFDSAGRRGNGTLRDGAKLSADNSAAEAEHYARIVKALITSAQGEEDCNDAMRNVAAVTRSRDTPNNLPSAGVGIISTLKERAAVS